MSNNKEKKDVKEQTKLPKFNSYWIYAIVFALILGYQLMRGVSNVSSDLSKNDFKVLLAENDIEKITIVNKDIAQIILTAEALNKEKHKGLSEPSLLKDANAPHYTYDFGDLQNFENELNSKKSDLDLGFDTVYDSQGDFMSQLIGWLPLILLVGIWIFFMKRMSGGAGGGGGGQIFNIGKSDEVGSLYIMKLIQESSF